MSKAVHISDSVHEILQHISRTKKQSMKRTVENLILMEGFNVAYEMRGVNRPLQYACNPDESAGLAEKYRRQIPRCTGTTQAGYRCSRGAGHSGPHSHPNDTVTEDMSATKEKG